MTDWTYRRYPLSSPPELPPGPALELLELWQGKRLDRAVPARRDLDAAELHPWFGDLLIAEVQDSSCNFRFRLFGTNIANALGRDLTGRQLSDPDSFETHAPALRQALTEVIDGPAIVTTSGGVYWQERSYLQFASLYLPLADDQGNVRRILGHCTFTMSEQEDRRALVAPYGLISLRF